ncbi:MAG: superoxide dismutase [Burkholderiales bacterium]
MTFELPPLPYPAEALAPYMSVRTLLLHHGKHHAGYVSKLNELVSGTSFASLPLDEVIRSSHTTAETQNIFNNAAQHSNHCKFWLSMKPNGGGNVPGALERRLVAQFGSVNAFKAEFVAQGLSQFGSGWVWLVETEGVLRIQRTANAVTPIITGEMPLLVCDVWEHAYYLDYENRRSDYLKTFIDHLVDWEAAAAGRLA